MTYMGDRKRGSVTDGDAVGSMDRIGGVEFTGISRHVSGGSGVHVPVAAAGVAGRGRSGVKSRKKGRVPRRRRESLRRGRQGQQWWPTWRRLLTVGRRVGLRRGVVRLVWLRPGAENARGRGPRNRHGVGVYNAGPWVLAGIPRGRLRSLLRWAGCSSLSACAPLLAAAATTPPLAAGCGGVGHGGGGAEPPRVPATRAVWVARVRATRIRRSSNLRYATTLAKVGSG